MKELSKIPVIEQEINDIEKILKKITDLEIKIATTPSVSAMNYSGMPHSSGVSDPTYELNIKIEKLKEQLVQESNKYVEKLTWIVNTISQIEDDETRAIARKRLCLDKKWRVIGDEMHIDRSACSRRLKNYLEENLHT